MSLLKNLSEFGEDEGGAEFEEHGADASSKNTVLT
ncbi:hypothetical protein A2U01_0035722, partial [Trifolium medium]|nr:hypothetical protein [Trifolium medium]